MSDIDNRKEGEGEKRKGVVRRSKPYARVYTQLDVLDIVGCTLEDACLVMELSWLLL